MTVELKKAKREDCSLIHSMQIRSFSGLLEKYKDFDINPGAEPLEAVYRRFDQPTTDYFLIVLDSIPVGAVRIVRMEAENACRVSPVFVLPEYQGRGVAQEAFRLFETIYTGVKHWTLSTILQEAGNCYLYEKIGYRKTGALQAIKPGMDIVHYEKIIL